MGAQAGCRVRESLLDIAQSQFPPDSRQIGSVRRASSPDHVAGGALPFAEEKALARRGIAGRLHVERGGIEGANETRQRPQIGFGERESGHAARGAVPDQIVNLLFRAAAQRTAVDEGWAAIRSRRALAVTARAASGE